MTSATTGEPQRVPARSFTATGAVFGFSVTVTVTEASAVSSPSLTW